MTVPQSTIRLALLPLLAAALAGCAGLGRPPVEVGSSVDEARRALGSPTGEYPRPDGGRRLEYATGPYGRTTWMLDYDAGGRLLASQQVLTEASFGTVRPGTPQDELRFRLGRPGRIDAFPRIGQVAWSWRYETPFCQMFYVMVGADGQVVGSGYSPDPVCEVDDVP